MTIKIDENVKMRLTEVLRESGLTSHAYAQSVQIDPSAFAKKLSGKVSITTSDLEKLEKFGGVSKEWLLTGNGSGNKYKGKKHLVYVLDKLPDYKNFLSNFNHTLKRTVPGISTYWSRHTVASIASKLDISTDTIGRMLGHSDKAHSTTDIYINYDMSKVDDAMRRVIDYIESL